MILGDQQALRHYCYQPKVMQQLLKLLHHTPIADFVISLLMLGAKYELPEKMSLWTHLQIGGFFPSVGYMLYDQRNEGVAAYAADFLTRVIQEMSSKVKDSNQLFEQLLETAFLEKLIRCAANVDNQFVPAQAENAAGVLHALVDASISAQHRAASASPASPAEYLAPLGSKLRVALRMHLKEIMEAFRSMAPGASWHLFVLTT